MIINKKNIKSIGMALLVFVILWSFIFQKDQFLLNMKNSLIIFFGIIFPGILIAFSFFEKEDQLIKIFLGLIIGVILTPLLYYLFSLINITLFYSVIFTPVLIVLCVVMNEVVKVKKKQKSKKSA